MADRFYVNSPLESGQVVLQGPEAHHLVNVRRLGPGAQVTLFNGDGRDYAARVLSTRHKSVHLAIASMAPANRELGYPLIAAVPLPKGDRAQFLVEKLTELGVTSYIPLRTSRSVVHPGDARREKLQRYVIEACKQCGRNVLLQIQELKDWSVLCSQADLPETRFVAHISDEGMNAVGMAQLAHRRTGAVFAVGPEGGFSDEEAYFGRQNGWTAVDMGPRVLKVETAALALAALLGLGLASKSPVSALP